jgi:hypothetical protein
METHPFQYRSHLLLTFCAAILITSCKEQAPAETKETAEMSATNLELNAQEHLDSTKWDMQLFQQDLDTYAQYPEVFKSFPLHKSPFPVAEYDYAVASLPFDLEVDGHIFKGIRVGEYLDPDTDDITERLTLLVLTNDKNTPSIPLVESRNAPYLTAQGSIEVPNNEIDWVFIASPEGNATLLVNMKLFDLCFGSTVLIYPQANQSFFYDQIKDSPENYSSLEEFEKVLQNHERIMRQLSAEGNI